MTAKRILVAGATGYLGGYVVREAATRKLRVRALARSESKLEAVADLVDEIVCAEAADAQSLVGICDGADWVFSSLGITRQTLVGGSLWVVKIFSRRRWNVTAFVSGACRNDMVGPQVGEHRLGPWFTERVAAAGSPRAS